MDNDYGKNLIKDIQEHLTNDGVVIVSTYCKATQYNKKHIDLFKVGSDGSPLALNGKHWLDISGCAVKFYTYKKVA